MSWKYSQSTGDMTYDGSIVGQGYSGKGDGRNNSDMQNVQDVGPIPVGEYTIGGAHNDGQLGPCVMNLYPALNTETFGRSLFRIHGDNAAHDASHGCIVINPAVRRLIAGSKDRTLIVTL